MKIGIVAANNLVYSPYVGFYTEIFKDSGIDCEVIFPDRNGIEDRCSVKTHRLNWDREKNSLTNYLKYYNNVKKTVLKEKYDFLILLTSISGVFLSGWVKKHYPGRYIVDIRDYTYEDNFLYYALEKKAVENSLLNVISSKKFTEFLPQNNYLVCHNITFPEKPGRYRFYYPDRERIVIGYIGTVTYEAQCEKLINLVKSDSRFEFHIYGGGVGAKELRDIVNSADCERIKIFGQYTPEEKESLIEKTDILFNAYGCGIPLLDTALSNKLYDSLYYRKFLLTSPGTYMEQVSGELAYSLDLPKADSLDGLYNWIFERDLEKADLYAENLLNEFIKENNETKAAVYDSVSVLK